MNELSPKVECKTRSLNNSEPFIIPKSRSVSCNDSRGSKEGSCLAVNVQGASEESLKKVPKKESKEAEADGRKTLDIPVVPIMKQAEESKQSRKKSGPKVTQQKKEDPSCEVSFCESVQMWALSKGNSKSPGDRPYDIDLEVWNPSANNNLKLLC